MDERWYDDLRGLAAAVRPTVGATEEVHREVRRRGRVRRVGVAAGAAGLVAAVAVGAVAVPQLLVRPEFPPGPGGQGGVASPSASTAPDLFDCPLRSRVFRESPAIPDLDEQSAIVESLRGTRSISAWGVVHAQPTHLGVVALVVNAEFAEPALTNLGVSHVYEWDPSGPEVGLDEEAQIDQALGWLLDPAVRDVRNASRGIAGIEGIALWKDAGAVLLTWKAPVPPEVQALEGQRPDGVRVVVDPTAYSAREFRAASQRVADASRDGTVDAEWSTAHGCGDGSGLVVGIEPESLGDRKVELQARFAEIAGMPVKVVPQEMPVPGSAEQPRR